MSEIAQELELKLFNVSANGEEYAERADEKLHDLNERRWKLHLKKVAKEIQRHKEEIAENEPSPSTIRARTHQLDHLGHWKDSVSRVDSHRDVRRRRKDGMKARVRTTGAKQRVEYSKGSAKNSREWLSFMERQRKMEEEEEEEEEVKTGSEESSIGIPSVREAKKVSSGQEGGEARRESAESFDDETGRGRLAINRAPAGGDETNFSKASVLVDARLKKKKASRKTKDGCEVGKSGVRLSSSAQAAVATPETGNVRDGKGTGLSKREARETWERIVGFNATYRRSVNLLFGVLRAVVEGCSKSDESKASFYKLFGIVFSVFSQTEPFEGMEVRYGAGSIGMVEKGMNEMFRKYGSVIRKGIVAMREEEDGVGREGKLELYQAFLVCCGQTELGKGSERESAKRIHGR